MVENNFEFRDGFLATANGREIVPFRIFKITIGRRGIEALPPTFFTNAQPFFNISWYSIVGPSAYNDIIVCILGRLSLLFI